MSLAVHHARHFYASRRHLSSAAAAAGCLLGLFPPSPRIFPPLPLLLAARQTRFLPLLPLTSSCFSANPAQSQDFLRDLGALQDEVVAQHSMHMRAEEVRSAALP